MEDHLIEEINFLTKNEEISEEEAFHKAVEEMGNREELSEAEKNVKKETGEKRRKRILINFALILAIIGTSIALYQGISMQRTRYINSFPIGYPVPGIIDVPFGERIHPIFGTSENHLGIDITIPYGSSIMATGDGIVTQAGWSGAYGLKIMLEHRNNLSSQYAQCSKLFVKVGERVKRGQIIALSGSSGTAINTQVHYEILQNGIEIDPEKFNTDLLSNSQITKKNLPKI